MIMEVTEEHLNRLNPLQAVKLVESIVYADARSSGIPSASISFSHNVNAPDGGVDGTARAKHDSSQGAIRKGLTCYQIKSGKFRTTPTNIGRMLFNDGALNERIKECLDCRGTLVVALTGCDTAPDAIQKKIKKKLGDEYGNARVEVWTQPVLRGLLAGNLAIRLQILGIDDDVFMSYEEWSGQDEMTKRAELGPEQEKFIEEVRRYLNSHNGKHLRVTAEPGVGKTRLVLEALKPKDFSSECVYSDRPSKLIDSQSFRYLVSGDNLSDNILVVDECDDDAMIEIWNRVKRRPRLRLITIYNEHGMQVKNMIHANAPPLDGERITRILESYDVPRNHLAAYCSMCGCSPRAAHMLGEGSRYQTDVIGPPDAGRLWDRYIASKTLLGSEEFHTRKRVLMWISLFRRIGFGERYSEEYKMMGEILEERENISSGAFTRAVNKLRGMRILQGDAALYITPKALHLRLWSEWHEQYENISGPLLHGYKPEDIAMSNSKANMLEWHADMYSYAAKSGVDDRASGMFEPGAYAEKYGLLESYSGAKLFHSLARVNLGGAVDCLERYILSKTGPELAKLDGGEWIVETLWGASMKRELFTKSACLLLSLAEAGGRYHSAADIFSTLFVPGSGERAQTEMPPAGRLQVIRDALVSINPRRRRLAVRACGTALNRNAITFSYDYWGTWQDDIRWTPDSETEISDYYKEVLDILYSRLEYTLEEEETAEVARMILTCGVGMLADPTVSGTVLDILEDMYKRHYVTAEAIFRAVSDGAGMFFLPSDEFRKSAGRLHDMLIGNDYHLMMVKTVAMAVYSPRRGDPLETMERLARRSTDVNVLKAELHWLVTDKAIHGHEFGYELGRLGDFGLLPAVLDAQKKSGSGNVFFLAGYLRSVFERDAGEWEGIMDRLLQDPDMRGLAPEIAAGSGLTDGVAVRIHGLVREGRLDLSVLETFIRGNLVDVLSEPTFKKWMRLLLDGDAVSRRTCLILYWRYYVANKRGVTDSARELLFSVPAGMVASDLHLIAFWCAILSGYVRRHPADEGVLPDALAFAAYNNADSGMRIDLSDVLLAAAAQDRAKAWGYMLTLLEPVPAEPEDFGGKKISFARHTLASGLADAITMAVICGWIDEHPARHAPLAAYILPDSLDIAAELLSRYGDIESVPEILTSNHATPNFKQRHALAKKAEMESFRKGVTDKRVLKWLDGCISRLYRGGAGRRQMT